MTVLGSASMPETAQQEMVEKGHRPCSLCIVSRCFCWGRYAAPFTRFENYRPDSSQFESQWVCSPSFWEKGLVVYQELRTEIVAFTGIALDGNAV
jgi:hypothetical protein